MRPEALVLDLVLQALDQRLDLRVLGADRVGEHVVERFHLLAAELLHPVELLLELGIGREVPGHGVSLSVGSSSQDPPPHDSNRGSSAEPHAPVFRATLAGVSHMTPSRMGPSVGSIGGVGEDAAHVLLERRAERCAQAHHVVGPLELHVDRTREAGRVRLWRFTPLPTAARRGVPSSSSSSHGSGVASEAATAPGQLFP